MVTQFVVEFISNSLYFVVGLIPYTPPPDFVDTLVTMAYDAGLSAAGVDAWLPMAAVGQVSAAAFISVGVAVTIRAFRMALSLVTGGGGSAA